jgi:hypothetical protein
MRMDDNTAYDNRSAFSRYTTVGPRSRNELVRGTCRYEKGTSEDCTVTTEGRCRPAEGHFAVVGEPLASYSLETLSSDPTSALPIVRPGDLGAGQLRPISREAPLETSLKIQLDRVAASICAAGNG